MILIIDEDTRLEPVVSIHPDRVAAEAALLDCVRGSWAEVAGGDAAPSDEDALVNGYFERTKVHWTIVGGGDWDVRWSDGRDRHERGQQC